MPSMLPTPFLSQQAPCRSRGVGVCSASAALRVLSIGESCPYELEQAISCPSRLTDCLATAKPLAFLDGYSVKEVALLGSSRLAIVKTYQKDALDRTSRHQAELEGLLHWRAASPSVITFYLCVEDATHLHIFMEYAAHGTLRQRVGSLGEREVVELVALPLLRALALLQYQGIVHRDIKPENIFWTDARTAKLGDFGLAVCLHDHQGQERCSTMQHAAAPPASCQMVTAPGTRSAPATPAAGGALSTAAAATEAVAGQDEGAAHATCGSSDHPQRTAPQLQSDGAPQLQPGGTPLYTAPEVLSALFNSSNIADSISHKNDVWSLGIVILEALTKQHPFDRSPNPLFDIVTHKRLHIPDSLSHGAQSWLRQALCKDPAARPTASELLLHPWITREAEAGAAVAGAADLSLSTSDADGCSSDCGSGCSSLSCCDGDALLQLGSVRLSAGTCSSDCLPSFELATAVFGLTCCDSWEY